MTLSYECKEALDMMDKGQHDARVWHLPYHSLPTPDPGPIPHHTRHVNQIWPDWATVLTVSNHLLPGFTCRVYRGYYRAYGGDSGSTVAHGGKGGGGH